MGRQDGIDLLLRSIAAITQEQKRDDILFVLIGAGTEQPRLKALAGRIGFGALHAIYGANSRRRIGRIPFQRFCRGRS